jgi:2-C-methyl-D-erythritol 4-phosphate cytidylyltransferase/2-C-methyl-D-erythritol 2,4-cyclodiphosphate synthase
MLGAGSSTRFKMNVKKQWLRISHSPLWLYTTQQIEKNFEFKNIIIVCSEDEIEYMKLYNNSYTYVKGGDTRQESLKNALLHVDTKFVLVSDIARACVPNSMIQRIINEKENADIVVPYLKVHDTVVYEGNTINRDEVKLIQTPQLSLTKSLKEALHVETLYTDDSSAIKANGGRVKYVLGDKKADKLTTLEDIHVIKHLDGPCDDTFVGFGFDVHQFCENKEMWLGGVLINDKRGFKAHSDGDVALHALIDAILGAIGAGDIGELFPDNDEKYKNADSKKLLEQVVSFVKKVGYEIINTDITIMAETPKLSPYKDKMRQTIASILAIDVIRVNVKATTTEKLGFVGRSEGIGVNAVATLKYINWKKENTFQEELETKRAK